MYLPAPRERNRTECPLRRSTPGTIRVSNRPVHTQYLSPLYHEVALLHARRFTRTKKLSYGLEPFISTNCSWPDADLPRGCHPRGTLVLTRLFIFLGLLAGAAPLLAQATPTASRAGDLILGAGYTSAESDYGTRFTGFAIYGDFDFAHHIGVEANFHKVTDPGGSTLYEKTYEIGPRYSRTYGPLVPYIKAMYGRGVFNYPPYPPPAPQNQAAANFAYNIYVGGLGTDIKVRPYLYLRADFEYQVWSGFRGTPDSAPKSLTPELFTFGAAYHFR